LDGGTGADTLYGGLGDDHYMAAVGQGGLNIVDSGGASWTDTIDLQGMTGTVDFSGQTASGVGWTLLLDNGDSFEGQTSDTLDLSDGASGIITFDDGSIVDFSGVERVTW